MDEKGENRSGATQAFIPINVRWGNPLVTIFEIFEQIYPNTKENEMMRVACPYRLCPLGAHSDHQFGIISGFALDHGVEMAFCINPSRVVELDSCNFDGRVQFIIQPDMQPREDWGRYAQGAVWALLKQGHKLTCGIRGVIRGSLPIGGLSSSAAVIISYLLALCKANEIHLTPDKLIDLALAAEKDYVGLHVGRLDQSCEVLSLKDNLLFLDTKTQQCQWIPKSPSMPPYEFAVFYSGVSRTLTGTAFNKRVDECKASAYMLKALEGMAYNTFSESFLRDVPPDVFARWEDRLAPPFARRCRHFYTEFERVKQGAAAWKSGDLHAFGRLMFESGKSSIENYETGSEELIAIYEIMTQTDGIYGGRFSGAGFKGCCVAIIDPQYRKKIQETVTNAYLKRFPQYRDTFSVHFCNSADGARCE